MDALKQSSFPSRSFHLFLEATRPSTGIVAPPMKKVPLLSPAFVMANVCWFVLPADVQLQAGRSSCRGQTDGR